MNNYNEDSFYVGQVVVGVNAPNGSLIVNGHDYIVSSWALKVNPRNGLSFWYIGVEGHHDWLSPKMFAPKPKFEIIILSAILENETKFVSAN